MLLAMRTTKAADGEAAEGMAACRVHTDIVTPAELKSELAADETVISVVAKTRAAIKDIMDDKDERLLAVVGPCSIHDRASAIEFAERLSVLSRYVVSLRLEGRRGRVLCGSVPYTYVSYVRA
jgi:3-deoxy-7-phosphoheptulonate synthase